MISSKRKCANRSMVAAEHGQMIYPHCNPAQARDSSGYGERISPICKHERHGLICRPQRIDYHIRSLGNPPRVDRQQHRCAQVRGNTALFL